MRVGCISLLVEQDIRPLIVKVAQGWRTTIIHCTELHDVSTINDLAHFPYHISAMVVPYHLVDRVRCVT